MIFAAVVLAVSIAANDPVVRIAPDQSVITAELPASGKAKPAFTLRCGEASWKWEASREFELRRPVGECTVSTTAADYRPAESPLPPAGNVALQLDKLPILSGVITDAETATPIAGADVLLAGGDLLAITDANGRFRVAIETKWPAALRIVAPGRAAKVVAVPKAAADTELTVTLTRGGTLAVTLVPPLGEEPVQWEVRRPGKHGSEGEIERRGALAAGQKETTIERLEAGSYHFVVKGEGPLQRAAIPVTIREGEVATAEVKIEPAVVELGVRHACKPLGNATVNVDFGRKERLWRSNITVDAEGRATEEIWQRGHYIAYVKKLPAIKFSRATRDLGGDGVTSWVIDVPDRTIRGRVVDETGKAVAGAQVSLYATATDQVSVASTEIAGADGTFAFATVPAGRYYLKVRGDGYQTLQTPVYPLAEDVSLDTREVVLSKHAGREATVVNARGLPLAGVAVYMVTQQGERRGGVTDQRGRLVLPVTAHESGLLIAIPSTGSIGITRFRSLLEAEHAPVEVKVPDGTASLELRAESTDGKPIGELAFMLAIDGTFVPLDAVIGLSTLQGLPLRTSSDGRVTWTRLPPARYEIWPL